ncbi:hypothetical protein BT93_J1580 [Corymbia citriodora subsp. variegata]|nr:hypothetical protein BT93_J1580 [Corymbia citriodora subsp. variegata]
MHKGQAIDKPEDAIQHGSKPAPIITKFNTRSLQLARQGNQRWQLLKQLIS